MNDFDFNEVRRQSFSQKISFFIISNFSLLKRTLALSVLSVFLTSFGKITYQVIWEFKNLILYFESFYTKDTYFKSNIKIRHGDFKLFILLLISFKIILCICACVSLYQILIGFLLSQKTKWNEFEDIFQLEKENFELFGRMVKIITIDSVTTIPKPTSYKKTNLPIRILITVFDYEENQNLKLVLTSLIPNYKLYNSIIDHCKMTNKNLFFSKYLFRSYRFYLFQIFKFISLSYFSGFYLFKENNKLSINQLFLNPKIFEKKIFINFNKEARDLDTIEIIGYEEQQKEIEKIRGNIEQEIRENKHGMIIHGPSGTGKTTAAINFLINCSRESSNFLCFRIDSKSLCSFFSEEKKAKYGLEEDLQEEFIRYYLNLLYEEFENENLGLRRKNFKKIIVFIDGVSISRPIKKTTKNFDQYAWQRSFIEIMNTKEYYYKKILNKFFFILTSDTDNSQSFKNSSPILKLFPNIIKFDYPDFQTAQRILHHYFTKFISHQKSLKKPHKTYLIHPFDQFDQFYQSYEFRKNKDKLFPVLSKNIEKKEIKDFLKELMVWIKYFNSFSQKNSIFSPKFGNFSNKYPFAIDSEIRDWIAKESTNGSTKSDFFIGGEKISIPYKDFVKIVSNIHKRYDYSNICFEGFIKLTGSQISSLFLEEYWKTFMSRSYSISKALKENKEIEVLKAILFETVIRVTKV